MNPYSETRNWAHLAAFHSDFVASSSRRRGLGKGAMSPPSPEVLSNPPACSRLGSQHLRCSSSLRAPEPPLRWIAACNNFGVDPSISPTIFRVSLDRILALPCPGFTLQSEDGIDLGATLRCASIFRLTATSHNTKIRRANRRFPQCETLIAPQSLWIPNATSQSRHRLGRNRYPHKKHSAARPLLARRSIMVFLVGVGKMGGNKIFGADVSRRVFRLPCKCLALPRLQQPLPPPPLI